MTKAQLIAAVADASGSKRAEVTRILDAVFGSRTEHGLIARALANGDKVSFPGFGTFKVSDRKAREGVNPATGAKIKIKARRVPRFTAGSGLKDAV